MSQQPRVPPGQRVVRGFPVLDLGIQPAFHPKTFRFEVGGLVEEPRSYIWDDLLALSAVEQVRDFHCVTGWSRLDVRWKGIRCRDLLALSRPRPEARHVIVGCADGYSTNIPLEVFLHDDVILAYELDGQTVPTEHGGPLRLVVPELYGWKSAKWPRRLDLTEDDHPGFWETRGYHNEGDPWKEQRYAAPLGRMTNDR